MKCDPVPYNADESGPRVGAIVVQGVKPKQATLDDLLGAIFDAETQKGNGYDVLASAAWDNVLEYARSLAVCNPLTELRMLLETGMTSRPTRGCNISIEAWFIVEEVLRIGELLNGTKSDRVANLKPAGEQREKVDSDNAATTRAYDDGDSRK